MVQSTRCLLMGLVGLLFLSGFPAPAVGQSTADQTGFGMLERLVVVMAKGVASGRGPEAIAADVVLLAKELKGAVAAHKVDDLFAVRYSKLLSAVRQGVQSDPEVLLWPMYRSAMADFIEERTGRAPDWSRMQAAVVDHGGSGVGLAILADAVMSEIVSLHIHLESAARRGDILKSYVEKSMK